MGPAVEVHVCPSPLTAPPHALPPAPAIAAQPAQLHVETVVLVLDDPSELAETASALCTPALWTRFAALALAFPRLKCVELQLESGLPESVDEGEDELGGISTRPGPAVVGITDAAFTPLIEAGKFACWAEDEHGDWKRHTGIADTHRIVAGCAEIEA